MAREKGQKKRTTNSRSTDETRQDTDKRSSVWASRLRAVVILLVVGVGAIFSGYTVGNYVMGWFFGDKSEPTQLASSRTNTNTPSGGSNAANTGSTNSSTTSGGATNSGTTSTDTATAGTTGTGTTGANTGGQAGLTSGNERDPANAAVGSTAPSTAESEVLYRVRVGSFATPEEAEPDLRLLKERGYGEAYVVKSEDGAAYHIQVGAFSSSHSAFNVEEQLRAAGFAVHIETVQRR